MSESKELEKYPYTITDNKKKLKSDNGSIIKVLPYIACGPKNFVHHESFRNYCIDAYNFEPRSDDVWLFGFPRSGTTLVQEMIWLIANDLDFDGAAQNVLDVRFPLIRTSKHRSVEQVREVAPKLQLNEKLETITEKILKTDFKHLVEQKERRFLKSHLLPSLMSPKLLTSDAKIVLLARNPKDTIISNYHVAKLIIPEEYNLTFEKYFHLFKANSFAFTPFFEHIKEYWTLKDRDNCLLLFYEEIIKDMRGSLLKMANFLGKQLSDKNLDELEKYLSIENFKKNPSVNKKFWFELGLINNGGNYEHIRSGKLNNWQNYFTRELNEIANEWTEENLRGTGITYPDDEQNRAY